MSALSKFLDGLFFHKIWRAGSLVVDVPQPIEFSADFGVATSSGRTQVTSTPTRGFFQHWGAATVSSGHFLLLGSRANNATGNASEDQSQIFCPRACTIKNMIAYSSGSMTVTLRKNGADTALAVALNNSQVSDSVNSVSYSAGNTYAIRITGTAGAQVLVAVEIL